MFKANVQFTDYISLAVMLLMFAALVAAQSGAGDYASENVISELASDLSHFRGEDE